MSRLKDAADNLESINTNLEAITENLESITKSLADMLVLFNRVDRAVSTILARPARFLSKVIG